MSLMESGIKNEMMSEDGIQIIIKKSAITGRTRFASIEIPFAQLHDYGVQERKDLLWCAYLACVNRLEQEIQAESQRN
jgi:hypothetical protein